MNKNQSDKDSLIKNLGALLLGLIVIALIFNVFFTPQQAGFSSMGHMQDGNWGMHTGYGMGYGVGTGLNFNIGSILGGLLIILMKLLSILLVIGLVVGLWTVVKDFLLSDGENPFASLTKGFTKSKTNCPNCGSSVNSTWDFCPDCGQPITKANKMQNNNQIQSADPQSQG